MTYIPKFPMERDKVVSGKEKVLAKWPDATCRLNYRCTYYVICVGFHETAYKGDTEDQAWADAARRLK